MSHCLETPYFALLLSNNIARYLICPKSIELTETASQSTPHAVCNLTSKDFI